MNFPTDDRYVRFTFADTHRMAGLLREFLPQDILQHLDLDRLRRLHENQVHNTLRETRDDLNLECPMLPSGKVIIRILVEHKSVHAPELWLQLMRTICTVWENAIIAPVIPVVIHTGEKPFVFETPQSKMKNLPQSLCGALPTLTVHAIDLARCTEKRIWNSRHLDHVSKVGLSILKLAQRKNLDIAQIRKILEREWPNLSVYRRKRYILAAINYLHYVSGLDTKTLDQLSTEMPFAHPFNPNSPYAQNLRAHYERGVEQGVERGIEQGIERGLEQGFALSKIQMIQQMLASGLDWPTITQITHLDQGAYESLKQKYGESIH